MSPVVLIILALVAVGILLVVPRKRSPVDSLLEEIDCTDDDIELAEAEEELRDLDVMATPEDAKQALPDWGPGVPPTKRRGTDRQHKKEGPDDRSLSD